MSPQGSTLGAWVCLFFVTAVCGCADRLLLHPTQHPIEPPGAERVEIPTEGGPVEAWVARSPGAWFGEPVAFDLEFLGNAARAERVVWPLALRWGDRPVEVWAVNYPGFGGSPGDAELDRLPQVARSAHDAVLLQSKGRPIVVGGDSLGATVALLVAAERQPAGVILKNPPPLVSLILRRHGLWNLWLIAGPVALQVPDELSAIDNARRAPVPAVFVSSSRDGLVPPDYQAMVIDAYLGPKRVVLYSGGHNAEPVGAEAREFERALAALWAEMIAAAESRPMMTPTRR